MALSPAGPAGDARSGAGEPPDQVDAVVIGAGHNGLVAANLLADAGWSVVVLEAAASPGGATSSAELTVPGFVHDVGSGFYPLAAVSPVIRRLGLDGHGLRWRHAPLPLAHARPSGPGPGLAPAILPDADATATRLEMETAGDGAAWSALMAEWAAVEPALLRLLFAPLPAVVPALRLLARTGPREAARLARTMLLPVRRLAEERFAGEGAALLLAGSALHADLGPEQSASAAFGWLLCALAQRVGFPVAEGGAGRIADALVDRLATRGGTVCCGQRAVRVVVRGGRAVAVRTAGGIDIRARRAVLGAISAPALLGRLVGPDALGPTATADLERFSWDHGTVKVDWALSAPVPWEADVARQAGVVHVADDLDGLTRWAAELATGHLPSAPFVIAGQQSLADTTRCPPGAATLWAYTRVPRRVRGDAAGVLGDHDIRGSTTRRAAEQPAIGGHWTGEAPTGPAPEPWLAGFADRLQARIEAAAPGFGDLVVDRHVLGPSGLQAGDDSLDGGALNGGTAQLHQQALLRPLPGWGRATTPIAGLFLASASAHPGGAVHGAPGAHAARAALRSHRRCR
ncbi:MAG: NAD(P)/FAD-dependent oxidoreductase [Actinomycetota bacterium]|nr:NAD(P)/FAD-dependent oxidoreductase [Actinomycetota bacterium]